MNYTVQDIFDSAIRLIDEQNESTGSTETADTKPYRVKAVSLVRNLIPRVYPVSDTYAASTDGKRPVCRMPEALTDELDLDQYICESVLPWGLAALLIIDDDRDKYNAYWDEFEKGIALARNSLPSEIGEVEDVYGGIEHGEYGAWLQGPQKIVKAGADQHRKNKMPGRPAGARRKQWKTSRT